MRVGLRIFLQFVVVVAGCLLFIAASDNQREAQLIFIVPFLLGLPGLVVSLLVLAPLERALDRRGFGAFIFAAGPLAGAVTPWLLFPLAGNTANFMAGAPMLSAIGAAWGLIWAMTRPIDRWRGTSPGR